MRRRSRKKREKLHKKKGVATCQKGTSVALFHTIKISVGSVCTSFKFSCGARLINKRLEVILHIQQQILAPAKSKESRRVVARGSIIQFKSGTCCRQPLTQGKAYHEDLKNMAFEAGSATNPLLYQFKREKETGSSQLTIVPIFLFGFIPPCIINCLYSFF